MPGQYYGGEALTILGVAHLFLGLTLQDDGSGDLWG